MAERIGANGLPMNKKIVTWEELQAQNSETETLQEILEVNPNAKKKKKEEPSKYEWASEELTKDEVDEKL